MTPILYASTETSFTSNGIGRLADARRCEVTEERNGQYELLLEYPVGGKLIGSLVAGNYIFATHDNSGTPQAFCIYSVSEPLEGFVTVRAWHISYALNNIILKPFTATSCADAVSKLSTKSINTNPFTFWTDKSVTANFSLDVPKSVRAVLGGSEGSLLDVYGKGEYEFDMLTVKLHLNRGADRGVEIRYGKNLVSLDRDLDASNVYNAVVPFWTDGETVVSLDHTVVKTGQTEGKAIALDLSDAFDSAPTTTQLENKAQARIDASANYTLRENLKIDFVQLWQTEEYKAIANLERVYLCDTVHIYYLKRGITATAKCIKVVYDTLRERYISMELGEPKTSLAQQIAEDVVQPAVAGVPSKSMMQGAIGKATELISGGFGGYIKFKYLSDGTPSEMLIMDASTEATATNIIRFNQNGIGFSNDGGSTYSSAWTIDGSFNADFITAGTMVANRIRAGLLTDETGDNSWNLDTGEFTTTKGTLGPFTIDVNGIQAPNVSISDTGISYASGSTDGSTYIGISQTSIFGQLKASGSWSHAFSLSPWASGGYNYLELAIASLTNAMFYDRADTSRDTHNDFLGGVSVSGLLTAANSLKVQGAAEISKHVYTDQAVDSNNPVVLYVGNNTGYWGGILFGVVQNVGGVAIAFTCDNGTLTARNLITNSAWTSSALGLSGSGTYLTITTDQPGTSYFSVFAG